MRVYFDPLDGRVLYTFKGLESRAPLSGDFIEVADQLLDPLESWKVQGGQLVMTSISGITLRKIDEVNQAIGAIRMTFITQLPGQDLIYKEKELEAVRFLSFDPTPTDLTQYPFLAAEVGSTAPTAFEVAQVYLNLAAQLRQVGSILEQARIGAIVLLEQATTEAETQAIMAGFHASLAQFS